MQLQALVDTLHEELLTHTVLHADETPVAMLKPGNGKTHKAYLWSYCTTSFDPVRAVFFDFAETRVGQHARDFLGVDTEVPNSGWHGTLVGDDYSGYKAAIVHGVIEAGRMAHARRKFHDLWANQQSTIAEQVLKFFGALYDIERDMQHLGADERGRIRQAQAEPITATLHTWLQAQRTRVPERSATARAIDYSLKRWVALTRYLGDSTVPCENNWVENQIRPIAIGRGN